jgi:NAD(P)-dependent dehydrogenase (short-subunit alcohol dehydrogenase family)
MSQVWFVTGCSRGLGRHLARAVLRAGHRLVATARRAESLDDLVAAWPEQTEVCALDVRDRAAAQFAVERAQQRFGRLDVLVNNAGHASFGSLEDTPQEVLEEQLATNFWGVVHLTRAALPIMRRQGRGHLVQVSSLGARMGTPGMAAYQAAKAAVNTLSLSLMAELGDSGVTVTIVEPGNLRTDILTTDSMTMVPSGSHYAAVLEPVAERLRASSGRQPGDPRKAAEAIVRIAGMDTPPERLVLGGDALEFAAAASRRLDESDARWVDISTSIDIGPPAT